MISENNELSTIIGVDEKEKLINEAIDSNDTQKIYKLTERLSLEEVHNFLIKYKISLLACY